MNTKSTATTLTPREIWVQGAFLTAASVLLILLLLAIPALRAVAAAGFAMLFITIGLKWVIAARSASSRPAAGGASPRGRAAA